MPRDYKVSLADILEAIGWIQSFVAGMTLDRFKTDRKTFDAVIRNLEVIGEAVKNVPEHVRAKHAVIPWQRIAGLRDILVHHYFGVDADIVWDLVQNKVPELSKQIQTILNEPSEEPP